jgi:hypothetical protein
MNNIYKISDNDPVEPEYTYYTIIGSHASIDENGYPLVQDKNKSLAYIKKVDNVNQFYLKVGSHGKIYNPIGLYSEGRSNKFMAKIGKNEYNFTRVNQKAFDMYLNFLKSKNIAWLNNAEREIR